jgi:predicted  nucleic acid-binding Zn-ribbon protein
MVETEPMNSLSGTTTEQELELFRTRCQYLEIYLSDLQLEVRRLQHQLQSTQRLLDTRSQQAAQQHAAALVLQRTLQDQMAGVQLELQQKECEVAALRNALAGDEAERVTLTHSLSAAERDAFLLRTSVSWRVTAPARWLLKFFRGF